MKKESLIIIIVYIFLFVSGSIYGIGEKTIVLGGESGWRMAESRAGVTEVRFVRPNPVLVLSSQTGFSTIGYSAASGVLGNFSVISEPALDLSISFDENNTGLYRDSIGKYKVSVSPDIEAADRRYARAGTGAALFHGNGPVIVEPQRTNALFVPNNRIRDFSVEFWLYPQNMENGEQVLSWSGTKYIDGNFAVQRILCIASKNKLQWSFVNFFTSTDSLSHINIEFSGNTPVVPKTWSHHLVRFDSGTGMVEYLVNGVSEAIYYATSTGRENSEVYTPVAGSNGMFLLGENFRGLIDEFKIHSICAGRSSTGKYVPSGGRTETRAIDLGQNTSGIVRIDASGGRISIKENVTHNEFRENGRFRFSDDAEMSFFIRSSENPYLLSSSQWVSFTPGVNFSGISGRYVQIAVDFYPSADGETSPYLEQLRIVYSPGEPPLPPKNFSAVAVDGGVLLRWKPSPSTDAAGYLVYYSSVRGELFGNDAALGPSPVNAGNRTSLLVEGLKNGTLYYFRIASYDRATGEVNYNVGEFSNEVTARPLAGLLLSDIQ
jgi:hypothetical protein